VTAVVVSTNDGKVAAALPVVVVVVISIVVAVVERGMNDFERTYFIILKINNSKLEFCSYFVRWSLFWMFIFLQILHHITIGIQVNIKNQQFVLKPLFLLTIWAAEK